MTHEMIIIEGTINSMKFSKTVNISFDPERETIEEAIIHFYGSNVESFEELAIIKGWRESYWTYSPPVDLVV